MAAGAWTFYNEGKKMLMDGTIDLDTDVFYMALYTSASNAATLTLSTKASVTNEVANGNGYATNGKVLSSNQWIILSAGAPGTWKFNTAARIWTATGGDILNVKFAVIYASGGNLMCHSPLSTAQFTVTAGNTLTITPATNGIFTLT